MLNSRQRNAIVRLMWKRVFMLGLFVVLVTASLSVWGVYQKNIESAQLRKESEIQLAELTKRQGQLDADIARLETNRGQEEALREQYALAGAGEHLIVIVDPPAPVPLPDASTTPLQKFWKSFWFW